MSEFALHARAILGLPVPPIRLVSPAASVPLLGHGDGIPSFHGLEQALEVPDSQLRLFGKPECKGHRRLAVAIAAAPNLEEARSSAKAMASAISIGLQ
jgi:phosphoribosylglycinamide formyltransferase 2